MRRHRGKKHYQESLEIPLSEICLSKKNRKALKRDRKQIEELRKKLERGENEPAVILIRRSDGLYDLEDGRHRFLAAELAGAYSVTAIVK